MSLQFREVGRSQGQASILYLHRQCSFQFRTSKIMFSQSGNPSESSDWTSVWYSCPSHWECMMRLLGMHWDALGCASLNLTYIACSSSSTASSSWIFADTNLGLAIVWAALAAWEYKLQPFSNGKLFLLLRGWCWNEIRLKALILFNFYFSFAPPHF